MTSHMITCRFNEDDPEYLMLKFLERKYKRSEILRAGVRCLYMADPEVLKNMMSQPKVESVPVIGTVKDGAISIDEELARR